MIVVVLFCGILSGQCEEDRFPIPDEASPMQCMARAQAAAAKRAELHEGERVERFGCVRSKRRQEEEAGR